MYLASRWTIHAMESVSSTQVPAREAAARGEDRAVWTADHQSEGRGRHGRSWTSKPCMGLAFSSLVRPAIGARRAGAIPIAAALAVRRALSRAAPLLAPHVSIKWPNDVLSDGRKFCGMICESAFVSDRIEWCVIGIGMNVLHEEGDLPATDSPDRPRPTSIAHELRRLGLAAPPPSLPRLLAEVLNDLDVELSRASSDEGRASAVREYEGACGTIGSVVRVIADDCEHVGTAVGIGESGELVVDTGGTTMAFAAADVVRVARG